MKKIVSFIFCLISVSNCKYLRENDGLNELDTDLIIETANGKIRGDILRTQNLNRSFYAFQSIPYAEPPVGSLRFKPPHSPSNWTGILDATKPPKACLQPLHDSNYMSEDCLFLNVFTPSLNSSTPLPVIFWIYGGFFMVGNGAITENSPDLFIEKDVIMVSINYRVGVFGFFSTDDDILSGNYGIKDAIMALRWVQENIARFGGDPTRVTLMGQSAGAASVALLLQSPLAEGLFSAAIMESGTSLNLWARTPNPTRMADSLAKLFNIEYNTSQELLIEMQKVDSSKLLYGSLSVDLVNTALSNPVNGLLFGPTIEPLLRGAVSGLSYENLMNGKFNKVPVLTGYNSGEGNSFLVVFDYFRLYLRTYDLIPGKLVPIDLNVDGSLLHKIGKMVKKYYFGKKSIASSREHFAKFITDHEFMRPANEFVRLLSSYIDVYFYKFGYEGDLTDKTTPEHEIPGTGHGEELLYLFDSKDGKSPSEKDLITRSRLVNLWTNFAKYHNPTPTKEELFQNVTWKPVEPSRINYLDIGDDLQLLENPDKDSMSFWKFIYKNYGVPPFDTY